MSSSLKQKRWEYDFRNRNEAIKKETSYYRPYLDFYNLKKPPFTITPDPEFLFSSSTHKTAIENILYGIEASMGFMLLIGEVGTGKTTICRAILDRLEDNAETVYIINPSLSGIEVIQAILDDLGIDYPAGSTKKDLIDRLNRFLLKVTAEKPVVIIIDDAQTMTPEGLENLRLLSNLETDKKKLLQLVLAGQQELQVLLARPELRQLRQRITISCRLDLIDRAELKQYISLRLFIAGDNGKISFTDTAVKKIHKASQGIPRLINIICDYALIAAYISDSYIINKAHAGKAINELRHQSLVDRPALSGSISCITEKRIWFELLLLFAGLLYLAFVYSGEIFDKGPLETFVQHENKVLHITKSPSSNTVNAVVSSDNIPVDVIQEDPTVTEVKSMSPEANTDSIIEKPDNYIIQIYSIKNRDAAMKEVMTLRQKGLDVHWNPVHMIEKGTWYRVYQGGFSTKRDAMAFKKEKGFPEGIIIYAPWTILINSMNNAETSEDLFQRLQKKGIDCVLESDGDTGHRIISGAFRSSERAQKASLEILDMGLNAKPILR